MAQFLFEVGNLRKVLRSHRQTLLTDDLSDNIASHSFRVTWIGYFLAVAEKADVSKVVLMCLLHDLPETRSGDQNWVHKRYVKVFEEEIIADQFAGLPTETNLVALAREYQQRTTKESQLAKDADLLDQILLLKEYAWQGNKEALSWLKGFAQRNLLSSKTALKWAKAIRAQDPSDWWSSLWTSQRR